MNSPSLEMQASVYLAEDQYAKAVELYEQAIADSPHVMSNYWHLGLVLLLQGQEAEAQMVWLSAMSHGDSEQAERWTTELIEVLETKAQQCEVSDNQAVSWLIRQHIHEIAPEYLNNLLQLICVSIKLGLFVPSEDVILLQVTHLIKHSSVIEIDLDLLLNVLQQVLGFDASNTCVNEFVEACITYYQMMLQQSADKAKEIKPSSIETYLRLADILYQQAKVEEAIAFYQGVLKIQPNSLDAYLNLGRIYYKQGRNHEGFNLTRQALQLPPHNLNLEQIQNSEFWQSINPELSVCKNLNPKSESDISIDKEYLADLLLNLKEEGYFQLDGLIPAQEIEKLAVGIERLRQHHLCPVFILVYDEVWQIFQRLSPLLSAILGPDYQEITFWAWYIDPKNTEAGWKPHIDRESKLRPDRMTDTVNIWIALTDATPLNGCMYIVPANFDPSYAHSVRQPEFYLQSVRALPVPAGSILGWNGLVWHWGVAAVVKQLSLASVLLRNSKEAMLNPMYTHS